ncbi:hypothetical protein BJ741DRAFT_574094 [Chytriomyces cf. hyalinus JEL632]|nr:hypothetical protein BJ741DRAFT_574094 [Chytriomyces cf. hyalinus JEL632]
MSDLPEAPSVQSIIPLPIYLAVHPEKDPVSLSAVPDISSPPLTTPSKPPHTISSCHLKTPISKSKDRIPMNTRKRAHSSYSSDASPINSSKGRSHKSNEKSVQTLSVSPASKPQQIDDSNSLHLPVKAPTYLQPQKCVPTELSGNATETASIDLITPSEPLFLNSIMDILIEDPILDDVTEDLTKYDNISAIDSSKTQPSDQSPKAAQERLPILAETEAAMVMVDSAASPPVAAIEPVILGLDDKICSESGKGQLHLDLVDPHESADTRAFFSFRGFGTPKKESIENHGEEVSDGLCDFIMGEFNETLAESAPSATEASSFIPCVPTHSSMSNAQELTLSRKIRDSSPPTTTAIIIPIEKDGSFKESAFAHIGSAKLGRIRHMLAQSKQQGRIPKTVTIRLDSRKSPTSARDSTSIKSRKLKAPMSPVFSVTAVKKGLGKGGIMKDGQSEPSASLLSSVVGPLKSWLGFSE